MSETTDQSKTKGRSEVGCPVGDTDWSRTALGPKQRWPQSLQTLVEMLFAHPVPMMLLWGPDLIQIYNDCYRPLIGGKHPLALGMAAEDCWPDNSSMSRAIYNRVLKHGESVVLDDTLMIGVTEGRFFKSVLSPVRDNDRNIAGILVSVTEFADSCTPEAQVRRSTQALTSARGTHDTRAMLAAIVESSDDAIIGKTVDGIISTWNQGAERMFGYSPEEAIGKPIFLILPAESHHEEMNIRSRLALGERIDHFETVRIAKDGGRIDVSLTVSPIKNMQGEIIGASKIVRDITAKKRIEADLARHVLELARSNRELEQFAYVASHDLQEPLRTVHSFAQLLQKKCGPSLNEEARVHLGFVVSGVKRMQLLITDLLSYCRISTTGSPFTSCDCNKLCKAVLEGLKSSIESHSAKITISLLPTIDCDDAQLGRVFQNLLTNAIKFHGTEAPVVHVFSSESVYEWIFSVSDQGIGISPEFFDRIFVIFQRLHTVEEFGGTGIGLATCKKIVERHGGRIWVESSPGKGSTFHFSVSKKAQHAK